MHANVMCVYYSIQYFFVTITCNNTSIAIHPSVHPYMHTCIFCNVEHCGLHIIFTVMWGPLKIYFNPCQSDCLAWTFILIGRAQSQPNRHFCIFKDLTSNQSKGVTVLGETENHFFGSLYMPLTLDINICNSGKIKYIAALDLIVLWTGVLKTPFRIHH